MIVLIKEKDLQLMKKEDTNFPQDEHLMRVWSGMIQEPA